MYGMEKLMSMLDYAFLLLEDVTRIDGLKKSDIDRLYERNENIVEVDHDGTIGASEEEIPIKRYNVATLRNLLRLERSEGHLQITSKRVIFRAAGRSIGGRTKLQQEFKVEEISGIEAVQGYKFSLLHILVGIFIVIVGAIISASIILATVPETWTVRESHVVERESTQITEIHEIPHQQPIPLAREVIIPTFSDIDRVGVWATLLGLLFGIMGLFIFFYVKRELFPFKLLALGFGYGSFAVIALSGNGFLNFIYIIVSALIIPSLILFAMRPDLAIIIKNNGGTENTAPISIRRNRGFFEIFSRKSHNALLFSEIIPTPETNEAIYEVGAIIRDMQTIGDEATIDKWKTWC